VAVSCYYDNADRLTASTVTGAPAGASPILATSLPSTGPSTNLTYDTHGDVTSIADQAMLVECERTEASLPRSLPLPIP
jgi:hypothetical protein